MAAISKILRNVAGGGLAFWCQGCKETHIVWIEGQAPADGRPRWGWNGDVEKPVFTPSVLVWWDEPANLGNPEALALDIAEANRRREAGETNVKVPLASKRCHTFVGCNVAQPGEIVFLSDCTHELAGKVLPLAELPPYLSSEA
jgi:hypothetical protein